MNPPPFEKGSVFVMNVSLQVNVWEEKKSLSSEEFVHVNSRRPGAVCMNAGQCNGN